MSKKLSTYALKGSKVRHYVAEATESYVSSICGAAAHISRVASPQEAVDEHICPDCKVTLQVQESTERLRS